MVFTLPKNASQDLHLKNTVMGYRVELPVHMVLTGNDYKMVLASFTYSHTWYNMPDVAGQAHMATFMFQPGPTGAEGSDESSAKYPFQGNIFIKSSRILPSDTWDHQTNPSWYKWPWHSNTAFTAQEPCPGDFQAWPERLHGAGDSYKHCPCCRAGQTRRWFSWTGATRASYMPKRDPVDSLYVHCDLAADARAVGNVRNCLLHAVPVEGHSCQVMCYKPWWLHRLDWLPMCWAELKDVHLLMMNSHDQKVPCEGCVCSVKLLTRQRANTFRSERERERETW